MPITALPPPPTRTDPINFPTRADAFLSALESPFVAEVNALQVDVSSKQLLASSAATSASLSQAAAEANANYKGIWTGLSGSLNIPATTSHAGIIWMLLENVPNVALETPGVSSKWRNVTNFLNGVTDQVVARDALDVYSKSEARGIFPTYSGSVLQQTHQTDAGSSTTSTSYINVNASVVSIYPKSANSKLIITCNFQGASGALAAVNSIAYFRIYESASAIGSNELTVGCSTASGGTGISIGTSITAKVDNTSTALRSFSLRAKTNNASSTASAINHNWTITEVQA